MRIGTNVAIKKWSDLIIGSIYKSTTIGMYKVNHYYER